MHSCDLCNGLKRTVLSTTDINVHACMVVQIAESILLLSELSPGHTAKVASTQAVQCICRSDVP